MIATKMENTNFPFPVIMGNCIAMMFVHVIQFEIMISVSSFMYHLTSLFISSGQALDYKLPEFFMEETMDTKASTSNPFLLRNLIEIRGSIIESAKLGYVKFFCSCHFIFSF